MMFPPAPEEIDNLLEELVLHIAYDYSETAGIESLIQDITGAPTVENFVMSLYSPAARMANYRYTKTKRDSLDKLLERSILNKRNPLYIPRRKVENYFRKKGDDETAEQRLFIRYSEMEDRLHLELEQSFLGYLRSAGVLLPQEAITNHSFESLPKHQVIQLIKKYSRGFALDNARSEIYRVQQGLIKAQGGNYSIEGFPKNDGYCKEGEEVTKINISLNKEGGEKEYLLTAYLVPYDKLTLATYRDKKLETERRNHRFTNPKVWAEDVYIRGHRYAVLDEAGWRNFEEDAIEWKKRDEGNRLLWTAAIASGFEILNIFYGWAPAGLAQAGIVAGILAFGPKIFGLPKKHFKETSLAIAGHLANLHKELGYLEKYGILADELSFRTAKERIRYEFSDLDSLSAIPDIKSSSSEFLAKVKNPDFMKIYSEMAASYDVIAGILETNNGGLYLDPKFENFVKYDSADFVKYITSIRKGNLTKRVENRHMVVKFTHRPLEGWYNLVNESANRRQFDIIRRYVFDASAIVESIVENISGNRIKRLVNGALKLDYNGKPNLPEVFFAKSLDGYRIYSEKDAMNFIREYRSESELSTRKEDWIAEYHAAVIHMSMLNVGKTQRNRNFSIPHPDIVYSGSTALYHMLQLKRLGHEGKTQINGKTELENLFNSTKAFISLCEDYIPKNLSIFDRR